MKIYKKLLIIIVFGLLFIFNNNYANAMSQNLNDLEFDIKIIENGDVRITEIWDANLNDTNTLFKSFTKDSKFKVISDVSVSEIDKEGNKISTFINSGEYKYHETKGYFHATDDDTGNYEIAWGVSADGSEHRIFKIAYTIENCVNVYNDCSEFYWKIIGDEWRMVVERVHGKLTLPSAVEYNEDFRVWAHGPLDGNISKTNNEECTFDVNDMPTNTFLELRIVFPSNIMYGAQNTYNRDELDNILQDEIRNAEIANQRREEAKKEAEEQLRIGIGLISIASLLNIMLVAFSIRKFRILNVKNNYHYDYFRDIPGDLSPNFAAALVNKKLKNTDIFSAMMMSLSQKGWISISSGKEKKDVMISIIKVDGEDNREQLTKYEQKVLNYLGKVGEKFSLIDFEKYNKKHPEAFYNLLSKYSMNETESEFVKMGYVNKESLRLREVLIYKIVVMIMYNIFFIFGLFVCISFMDVVSTLAKLAKVISIIYVASSTLGPICCFVLYKKNNIYTEKGLEEKAKWIGLKNFMNDFSLLNEREIPELALWDKYLVYATAFGIADKVIKGLKTKYPQLQDDEYIRDHYFCIHMATNSNLYGSSFDKSVSAAESYHNRQVAYSSMSSGSGGGGGFSSGGGGGRRRRRPEVDVKK